MNYSTIDIAQTIVLALITVIMLIKSAHELKGYLKKEVIEPSKGVQQPNKDRTTTPPKSSTDISKVVTHAIESNLIAIQKAEIEVLKEKAIELKQQLDEEIQSKMFKGKSKSKVLFKYALSADMSLLRALAFLNTRLPEPTRLMKAGTILTIKAK